MSRLILREAWALVRSQVALTTMILCLVAATTGAVMLTAGRAAATEQAVLAAVDAQGTRLIIIRAKGPEAGLDTNLVITLSRLDEVEAVTGFGPVRDATPAALTEKSRIGVRTAVGFLDGEAVTQPAPGPLGPQVWLSPRALLAAGVATATASLRYVDGQELVITRRITTPDYLADLEPLAIVPAAPGTESQGLTAIYVLTRTPGSVTLVTRLLQAELKEVPRDQVTVATTQAGADLRAAISGELTRRNRSLILQTLAAFSAATALTVLGYVTTRRRDIGRRRALGATRLTLIVLVLTHLLLTSIAGTSLGLLACSIAMHVGHQPAPTAAFNAAVAIAVIGVTTLAALPPVAFAATRDPVRELRVP